MPDAGYLNHHEHIYRVRKAEGQSGWAVDAIAVSMYDQITVVMEAAGQPEGPLLELGCGAGNVSLILARHGFDVYGIDIAPTAVRWAAEEDRIRHVLQGDVCALPYASNRFGIAIDSHCWHCIIGADRVAFLHEVHRTLKPGGLLIVMTKCGVPQNPDYPFDPVSRCRIENGRPTRYWGTRDALLEELRAAGFDVVYEKVYAFDHDKLVAGVRKRTNR